MGREVRTEQLGGCASEGPAKAVSPSRNKSAVRCRLPAHAQGYRAMKDLTRARGRRGAQCASMNKREWKVS